MAATITRHAVTHAIIGTAGHIDHGKTALIKALTGQDTDRLKEEKERGISIDLGFAHLILPDGTQAGVVDVPGHERFIRNMLAGAHGIDLVLFTVAADDGVMPQTEEHLDILHLLGVRRGIFVITKTDLVDAARVAAVREEIEILTLDTTLEGVPVVPVSTLTGAGLDALRAEIAAQLGRPAGPPPPGYFRLPVDRAFVIRGHGVVVTGTAIAGSVGEGDTLRVLPGGETARVRSLEVHGAHVSRAEHGQRVAINLAGVERSDLGRGHVVCDERLSRLTARLDARVEIRPAAKRPIASHTRVRFHLGTAEVMGKLVLLGGHDELPPRSARRGRRPRAPAWTACSRFPTRARARRGRRRPSGSGSRRRRARRSRRRTGLSRSPLAWRWKASARSCPGTCRPGSSAGASSGWRPRSVSSGRRAWSACRATASRSARPPMRSARVSSGSSPRVASPLPTCANSRRRRARRARRSPTCSACSRPRGRWRASRPTSITPAPRPTKRRPSSRRTAAPTARSPPPSSAT